MFSNLKSLEQIRIYYNKSDYGKYKWYKYISIIDIIWYINTFKALVNFSGSSSINYILNYYII